MKKQFILLLIILLSISTFSQLTVEIGTISTATVGSTIHVPVTVITGTEGVTAIQIAVIFDSAVLTPVSQTETNIGLVNPHSLTTANGATWMSGNGNPNVISSNWFDPTYIGINIPDSTVIYELEFVYQGGNSNLLIDEELSYFYDTNFNEIASTYITGFVGQPLPFANTLQATVNSFTSVILNGIVNPNGTTSDVSFEYGLTTDYGSTINATQGTISGNQIISVDALLEDLTENTTYHFRVVAQCSNGTTYGEDMTFFTNPNSVEELFSNKTKIYNFNNSITVETSDNTLLSGNLMVYDLTGKIVESYILDDCKYFNTEFKRSGIFIVKLATDKKVESIMLLFN